jgi:hypothetical protein
VPNPAVRAHLTIRQWPRLKLVFLGLGKCIQQVVYDPYCDRTLRAPGAGESSRSYLAYAMR